MVRREDTSKHALQGVDPAQEEEKEAEDNEEVHAE